MIPATIPQEGSERLAWFRNLDEAVALDVLATGDDLADLGWPRDEIRGVLGDFDRYLAERIAEAVALAADVWAATR